MDVDSLTYAWPDRSPVLQDCRLQVPRGQFWMLLGANGSGKSTLLKLMSGLLDCPKKARVQLDRPVGFVFQNPDRQLVMPTVGADVAFSLAAENLTQSEVRLRVEDALSKVGLLDLLRRPIYALSGGQKHRVAIAGALARQSRLILLDEPTALLDPDSQIELVEQIRRLVDETGITALWITHRLEELNWADRAVLLARGSIVADEPPEIMRQNLGKVSSCQ
ncbi:MAG: energy-coupling factor ABC transporter ATP-binding protein [Synechococcus sp.]